MQFGLQLLVAGLAMGAIYALVALGFVLLVNAVNIINFAQGEFVMVGAFLAYTFGVVLHWPYWATVIAVVAVAALVGIVFERMAYYPLRGREPSTFLVSTLAVSVFLRNVAQQIWGPMPFAYTEPFGQNVLKLGPVPIVPQHLLIIAALAVLVGLLYGFLFRTRLGTMMRAASQDRVAAQVIGIRVNRIGVITFMIAAASGAVAGVLVAPVFFVSTEMGFGVGLKAFIATIIGGWGSVPGAIAGGLLLGIVEVAASAYNSGFKDLFAFGLLILFLIVLPRGIFGEKIAEKA
ncbi:MAG TPA: branched-chain amino acid ABC transporter permease [Symbiobacteriaceae bacterium]|jgi:branched-chain amino acid transport system permease protein